VELIKTKKNTSRSDRLTTRAGSYSVFATLLILGIIITTNRILATIPQSYLKLDVTASKMFSLSDQTKQVVESIREEVIFYWVAEKSSEDPTIGALLSRYVDLSRHIVIKQVDPTENPNFVKKYTATSLANNSVIVEMGQRYKIVDYSTVYAYDVSKFYETGQYTSYFDGEAILTSAIGYVTNEDIPKLYFLTGHEEPAAISDIAEKLHKDNVEVAFYSLISGAAVPDDADILFIYNPGSDYSQLEVDMLISYMDQGGKIIIITDFVNYNLPHLKYLAEYYALKSTTGLVIERNAKNYAWGRPSYLLPDLQAHAITNALKNRGHHILMPGASGFKEAGNARDSLTVTPLLVTQGDAFAKAQGYDLTTMEKQGTDEEGPFMVGALVKEQVGAVQGDIIWYTSGDMLVPDINGMVSGANMDLFCNSVAFLAGNETSISIRSKVIVPENLQITASTGNIIAVFLIGLLPIAYIIPGIIITIRRKRRK